MTASGILIWLVFQSKTLSLTLYTHMTTTSSCKSIPSDHPRTRQSWPKNKGLILQSNYIHIKITTLELKYGKLSLHGYRPWSIMESSLWNVVVYIHREKVYVMSILVMKFHSVQFLPFLVVLWKETNLCKDASILTFYIHGVLVTLQTGLHHRTLHDPLHIIPMHAMCIHIGNDMQYFVERLFRGWMQGCSDLWFFIVALDTYFSGCMTLMIQSKWNFTWSDKLIIIVYMQNRNAACKFSKNISLTHDKHCYVWISRNACPIHVKAML